MNKILGDNKQCSHLHINICPHYVFFRVDYHKHPYIKPYVRPAEQYVAPEGVIDPMTSYNKEYTRKSKYFFFCIPTAMGISRQALNAKKMLS